MAYLVPSDLTQVALAKRHGPELETLAALRRDLGPEYTIFHGVHWSRAYRGHTVFGEADFIVVNRSGDALVIEQKNGALDETENGLVKRYDDGAKNVGDQVRRALENLREKFKWQNADMRPLRLDYLVYCPDYRIRTLNAAALDRNRIVDAGDGYLAERIAALFGPGADDGSGYHERVLAFFAQTFEVAPDIHAHASAQARAYTRLSGGLARTLESIEMTPLRLRVRGTAGCGKSAVALRFFVRAVEHGRRPLLVCYNRPLKEKLSAVAPEGGLIETWNGLCKRFLEARGHCIEFDRMAGDHDFWRRIEDRVVGEEIPEDWRFDTVIVDEGQDFAPAWFDILRLFWREGADVLWLEDPDQNLRGTASPEMPGFIGFRTDANYRTPETIARFIHRVLPFHFENANDLPGLGVGVTGYDDPAEQPAVVARLVDRLLRMGFAHRDIVILSMRGTGHSALSDCASLGNFTLARFAGTYDALGNQMLTDGQIRLESVSRFKGHQAPAMVLVDVDPGDHADGRDMRLLFTGMTRATVRLEIVARRANPRNAPLFV